MEALGGRQIISGLNTRKSTPQDGQLVKVRCHNLEIFLCISHNPLLLSCSPKTRLSAECLYHPARIPTPNPRSCPERFCSHHKRYTARPKSLCHRPSQNLRRKPKSSHMDSDPRKPVESASEGRRRQFERFMADQQHLPSRSKRRVRVRRSMFDCVVARLDKERKRNAVEHP
jgi:hypothetical protein